MGQCKISDCPSNDDDTNKIKNVVRNIVYGPIGKTARNPFFRRSDTVLALRRNISTPKGIVKGRSNGSHNWRIVIIELGHYQPLVNIVPGHKPIHKDPKVGDRVRSKQDSREERGKGDEESTKSLSRLTITEKTDKHLTRKSKGRDRQEYD